MGVSGRQAPGRKDIAMPPHDHGPDHHHHHGHHHDHGHRPESVPLKRRVIEVERGILDRNDTIAAANRRNFADHRVLALNLMSSPGAGKTTLLVETLKRLRGDTNLAVIEVDQQTALDADRIAATGVPVWQVNTGKGCHLEAADVAVAFDRLHFANGVLFIENVGNLVCPAGFDLGEAHKVVVCSVTEGEDKPLKYPDMFAAAGLMLISKADLAPHCDVDIAALAANARRVNPGIGVITLSARSGEGLESWLGWIAAARALRAVAE
ncbi:MAG: hydrogenase nickel incorporation protein HypB [Hyphomicrobiaceae bacterium]|nr:hydrogenase nickel incorporation protein HypB [Hyphomicrobiaceae bacterium]